MLVCGEDLGMVPDCVPGVMDATGVLSLRIQRCVRRELTRAVSRTLTVQRVAPQQPHCHRMPADTKQEWGVPKEYPYMSVCSTSSHDTSTLRCVPQSLLTPHASSVVPPAPSLTRVRCSRRPL